MGNNRNNNRADRLQSRMAQAASLSEQASKNEAEFNAKIDVPEGTDSAASTIVEESPVGVSVATAAQEQTAPVARAVDAYADKSDIVRSIIVHLETYALEASPGKVVNPDELLSLQKMLIRTTTQLVNLPDHGEFAICFSRLLKLVRENKDGAFAGNMIFRGLSRLPQNDTILNRYRFFMDMIVAFSDPSQRRLLIKKWNLQQGSSIANTVDHQERIAAFIREISGEQ